MIVRELCQICGNISYDTTVEIKYKNMNEVYEYAIAIPDPVMKQKIYRFYIKESRIIIELEV